MHPLLLCADAPVHVPSRVCSSQRDRVQTITNFRVQAMKNFVYKRYGDGERREAWGTKRSLGCPRARTRTSALARRGAAAVACQGATKTSRSGGARRRRRQFPGHPAEDDFLATKNCWNGMPRVRQRADHEGVLKGRTLPKLFRIRSVTSSAGAISAVVSQQHLAWVRADNPMRVLNLGPNHLRT